MLYQENKALRTICMFCICFLSKLHHFALIIAKRQFKDNQSVITWDTARNL